MAVRRSAFLGLVLAVLLFPGIVRAQAEGNCTVDIYGRTVQLSAPVCAAMAEAGDDVCRFVLTAVKQGLMDNVEKELSASELVGIVYPDVKYPDKGVEYFNSTQDLSRDGIILVAHAGDIKLSERDFAGKEIYRISFFSDGQPKDMIWTEGYGGSAHCQKNNLFLKSKDGSYILDYNQKIINKDDTAYCEGDHISFIYYNNSTYAVDGGDSGNYNISKLPAQFMCSTVVRDVIDSISTNCTDQICIDILRRAPYIMSKLSTDAPLPGNVNYGDFTTCNHDMCYSFDIDNDGANEIVAIDKTYGGCCGGLKFNVYEPTSSYEVLDLSIAWAGFGNSALYKRLKNNELRGKDDIFLYTAEGVHYFAAIMHSFYNKMQYDIEIYKIDKVFAEIIGKVSVTYRKDGGLARP